MFTFHRNRNFLSSLFKYRRKFDVVLRKNFATEQNIRDETKRKLKLLFFGTDTFSLNSLVELTNARKTSSTFDQVDVVTSFKSHSNPVKKFATKNGLKCSGWPISVQEISQGQYDLGVVVSFGHLIPEEIINAFPFGMINVHGSLLPRWRGASPIIHSILNDEKVTGVSIMKIRPAHFDIGEVLGQKEIVIKPNILMPELHAQMAEEGAQLLLRCIEDFPNSFQNAKPQSEENVSYAPKIQDSMTQIEWNKMTAREVFNLYRALYSFKSPRTTWHERKLRLIELKESSQSNATKLSAPGAVEYDRKEKCLRVRCVNQTTILISKLQLEGKRVFTANEFNSGFLKKVPENERFFR